MVYIMTFHSDKCLVNQNSKKGVLYDRQISHCCIPWVRLIQSEDFFSQKKPQLKSLNEKSQKLYFMSSYYIQNKNQMKNFND